MWADGGPREFGSAGVRASRPWRPLGSVARLRCRTGVKRATRPPTYDPQHVSCIAIHTKGVTTMARPSPMVFAGLSADSSIDVTRPNGISNGIRPLGLRRTSVPTNLSPSILAWSTRGTARGPEPEQSQLSGGGGIDVASRRRLAERPARPHARSFILTARLEPARRPSGKGAWVRTRECRGPPVAQNPSNLN